VNDRNEILVKLYTENYKKYCKAVNRRAGGEYNAEDVVQEAFCRALKYWPTYNPEKRPLEAWFVTILNNALRDFKREELAYGTCDEFNEEEYDGQEMSQTDAKMVEQVQKLINQKDDGQREILELHFSFGYKPSEIVEILDVVNGTVRQTIWRFKEEVRVKLKVA